MTPPRAERPDHPDDDAQPHPDRPDDANTIDGRRVLAPQTAMLEIQLRQVRRRVIADAAAAGLPVEPVHELLDRTAAAYRNAPVQTFVPVLVERAVRTALAIPRSTPGRD